MASKKSIQGLPYFTPTRLSQHLALQARQSSTTAARRHITTHHLLRPSVSRCQPRSQNWWHSDAASTSRSRVYGFEKVRFTMSYSAKRSTNLTLYRLNPYPPLHLPTTFSSTYANLRNTKPGSFPPQSTYPSHPNRTRCFSRPKNSKTALGSRNRRPKKN